MSAGIVLRCDDCGDELADGPYESRKAAREAGQRAEWVFVSRTVFVPVPRLTGSRIDKSRAMIDLCESCRRD